MSIKTVRMAPADEKRLARIRRRTGWTTSEALKRGLRALEREIPEGSAATAFDIYSTLDLGPGGTAADPASRSRETARRAIARRHGR